MLTERQARKVLEEVLYGECGGLTAVADKLGVTRQCVWQWNGQVPLEQAISLAALYDIPLCRIRPDKFYQDGSPKRPRKRA